jgi:5-methylcytosine-specific restriction endonuclease McrA
MTLCDYGCGKEAIHQFNNGKWCCSSNATQCPYVRKLTSERLSMEHTQGKRKPDSFGDGRKWRKGKKKYTIKEVTDGGAKVSKGYIKKLIMEDPLFIHQCEICKRKNWMNQPITLEMDHINGINTDNKRTNLRFLCPNCHSQTKTWKGKNTRNKRNLQNLVSDDIMKDALKTSSNIRQALAKAGLSESGKNYTRMYELAILLHIEDPSFNIIKKFTIDKTPTKTKVPKDIVFPIKEIKQLVKEKGLDHIANKYGVSCKCIKTFCQENNIKIYTLEERREQHKNISAKKVRKNKRGNLTKEQLQELVNTTPFTTIGKMFGVTDNAVRKWCKTLKVNVPKRNPGHWAKLYANKSQV